MVLSFTLDTNCLIAVDASRPEASFIKELVRAHQNGCASVGLVAISASERQQNLGYLDNFCSFKDRVETLGLGCLELLEPMTYWNVTYADFGLYSDDAMELLERKIHEILFPNIPFRWIDFCSKFGIDPNSEQMHPKWRNAKCDVQAFWSHAYRKRDVFVTSDHNFHKESKKSQLLLLCGGRVEYPEQAAKLIKP